MSKKIIFVFGFLIGICFISFPVQSIAGDVNNNGIVDVIDALLVAQYAVDTPVTINTDASDVDCSHNITIIDALLIAQYTVGIINKLCILITSDKDIFGITQIYPTLPGSKEWNSLHWNNGVSRQLSNDILSGTDPYDPTTWSEYRGDGILRIDGKGILLMGGNQPRIYINSYPGISEENPEMFFKNVEVTVYYMRIGNDGANWGGCVIGVRSGPNGHSSWGDYYDATTYYARMRHDGRIDLEKELHHPDSSYILQKPFFNGNPTPSGKWYGVKFCVYNIAFDSQVKLEMYLDLTSDGTNGGNWQKVLDYTDNGNWTAPASGAPYPENMVITTGGGVVLIRNTEAVEARYKWFSVREINALN